MTDFVPPKPPPLIRKLDPISRLIKGRRCSISVLYDRSYSMKMGEIWMPFHNLYFVNQPDLVDRVLSREANRFPKSNLMAKILSSLLGDGIFVSHGELWKKQRRMMDPAFSQARIKDVFPLMCEATEAMGARLREQADGAILPIDVETTHVTADIVFQTIFSRELLRDESARIFRAFGQFQDLTHSQGVWMMAGVPKMLSPGLLFAARHARVIRGLLERSVDARFNEIAEHPEIERKDILASLLKAVDSETGAKFTRKELVDQIAVLFLAGHETSASSLAWALYMIAMRPDVQERMHAEAASVFNDRPDFSDMKRLKFTRDVFWETLRLYPPVSFIIRDATQVEHMRNKVVKKGEHIFVSPWLLHRHRKFWAKPDVFDPDRFSRPETKESLRTAYIPFSAGPRVCLGASFAMQEGVLILAYLMRHFRFEPLASHVPKPIARLTLRSQNGIRLRVYRREDDSAAISRDESAKASDAGQGCPYHQASS